MFSHTFRALCIAAVIPIPAGLFAQEVVTNETFDAAAQAGQIQSTPPAGWSVQTTYSDGTAGPVTVSAGADWLGWKFVDQATWTSRKGTGNFRSDFTKASSGFVLAESDGVRPTPSSKRFTTSLISPTYTVTAGAEYVLKFASHYRQGCSSCGQTADVLATPLDANGTPVGAPIKLLEYSIAILGGQNNVLNSDIEQSFTVPSGAASVQLSWNYRNNSNNWYWAIDGVSLLKTEDQAEPPAFDTSTLPANAAEPAFLVRPTLQGPGPDRMVVMFETTEPSPTVWRRKHGSTGAFTIVQAKNAEGNFYDPQIFFAEVDGLDSNTLYEYAVVTGTSIAPKVAGPFAFKTWPKEGDGVTQARFATVADTQDGAANRFKTIVEQGMMFYNCGGSAVGCAENIAGLLVPGDQVGTGSSKANWYNHFFGPMQAISPYVPIIPAPGNHEYFGEAATGDPAGWARTYRKYFNKVPDSGSTTHPLHWYHTDYLGLRIVSSDFNPASAMHNTGGWNSSTYDSGRGLFHESYMREHLDWFNGVMADTRSQNKSHVLLLNHHPCLATKWRQGEVVAACDFIAQLEDYGRESGAITANLNGHIHTYERGNSMDTRHLWLNVATASGDLEPGRMEDETDLDVFVNTHNAYGYGMLTVDFGATKALNWERRHLSGTAVTEQPADSIRVTSEAFDAQPTLPQRHLGKVDIADLKLAYTLNGTAPIYEAQWQVSQDAGFGSAAPVFDVWGDATRRENWMYVAGTRTNTQAGVDITRLALSNLLQNPVRIYPNVAATTTRGQLVKQIIPGANDLLERWNCARKWDDVGDVAGEGRQGGRQCYARLSADGVKGSLADPFNQQTAPVLAFADQQQWFYRVRVRDDHLNWSGWSETGSFQFGDLPRTDVMDETLTAPDGSDVALNIESEARCAAGTAAAQALPADVAVPQGWAAPFGAIGFQLDDCTREGFTAFAQVTLEQPLPEGAKLAKYRTGSDVLTDIDTAQISGNIVRWEVIDGGPLDEDGEVNGAIKDPVVVLVPHVDGEPDPVEVTPVPVPVNHPLTLAALSGVLLLMAGLRSRRKG